MFDTEVSYSSNDDNSNGSSDSLSTYAIIGIVVAIVVVLGITSGVCIACLFRPRSSPLALATPNLDNNLNIPL